MQLRGTRLALRPGVRVINTPPAQRGPRAPGYPAVMHSNLVSPLRASATLQITAAESNAAARQHLRSIKGRKSVGRPRMLSPSRKNRTPASKGLVRSVVPSPASRKHKQVPKVI